MIHRFKKFFLVGLLVSLTISIAAQPTSASPSNAELESENAAALHDTMRNLWKDHII